MSTGNEENEGVLVGGDPTVAPTRLGIRSRIRGIFASRGAKISAFIGAAATVATGLGSLTEFGSNAYVSARQLAFEPRLTTTAECSQSEIALYVENSGWTSIAIFDRPKVIWLEQNQPPRPPALYTARHAPPSSDSVAFPVRLNPGETLDIRLEHDGDGFYFRIDPQDRQRRCQLKITIPIENQPGPRKRNKENEAKCTCV